MSVAREKDLENRLRPGALPGRSRGRPTAHQSRDRALRRFALNWALGAVAATIALLVVRGQAPGRHELELDVYILVLGLMALLAIISWLRRIAPAEGGSRLAAALEPRAPEVPRIAELDRLERELTMSAAREYDFHYRLRPVVREIAAGRLERRGFRLDSGSEAVRELLGEDLWTLVDPDRKPPPNRQSGGPGLADLRQTVETLERL